MHFNRPFQVLRSYLWTIWGVGKQQRCLPFRVWSSQWFAGMPQTLGCGWPWRISPGGSSERRRIEAAFVGSILKCSWIWTGFVGTMWRTWPSNPRPGHGYSVSGSLSTVRGNYPSEFVEMHRNDSTLKASWSFVKQLSWNLRQCSLKALKNI